MAGLVASPDRMDIAFRMFDQDGSGKLDLTEVRNVLQAHRGSSGAKVRGSCRPAPPRLLKPPLIRAWWCGACWCAGARQEPFARPRVRCSN